ncbi:elongation factor Tu, mitochondrial-like [Carya illinoinensis]|uniref:elongation factor Tu, mitochondrial-like n=1 Tax=Carya illinoinensis TaxID=32201 RepID=UPI001C71F8A1|nr:elongation factor Tu, mitochondrial-like [Carya illinoinensis]
MEISIRSSSSNKTCVNAGTLRIQNVSLSLILEFSCDAFQGASRRGIAKAVAFDGIDKAPEEKKGGITNATKMLCML